MSVWVLHFDALTEPTNPGGWMCWGWTLDMGFPDYTTGKGSIPPAVGNTNNSAEYVALGFGLREVVAFLRRDRKGFDGLICRGDSKIVVNQVNNSWRINSPHLVAYHARCHELLREIGTPWTLEWVPREDNAEADQLSRIAYHEATGLWPPVREKRKGVRT